MSDRQDVQSSLADMDRKLRELQRELAMVSQPPQDLAPPVPPVAPAAAPSLPPRPAPASLAPPIAPTPAFSGPPPLPAGVSRPIAPGAQGPPPSAPVDPLASNPPSPAGAQAQVARIVDEAASRVTELGRQVDDLQRLREELQRSTLALKQEYGHAFDHAAAPAPPIAAPSPAAAPPSPPSPPAAPATAASPSDGHAFEGDVVINAGPFLDIGTLGAFEQALAQLPHAEDVYVRGFEGNRALIDLRLAGPIHLVDEMRRLLPFSFGVVEVGDKLVTINVDSPDAPGGGASAEAAAT